MEPLHRRGAALHPPIVELVRVQRRLELLLAAMYEQPMRVIAHGAAPAPSSTDVVLPPALAGGDEAIERYRLLAIEQGARIARGSRWRVPMDALEADLYMLMEGAAVDATIVAQSPGLTRALTASRAEELARRPRLARLTIVQRDVEQLVQRVLASEPHAVPDVVPMTDSAEASADAARELAARIRAASAATAYRPILPVALWDDARVTGGGAHADASRRTELNASSSGAIESNVSSGEDSSSDGSSADSGKADVTERGAPTAGDDPSVPPAEGHDSSTETAPTSSTSGTIGMMQHDAFADEANHGDGVPYPEWLDRYGRLEPRHVLVRPVAATEDEDLWARNALREHGPVIRQLRDRFALLRAQRVRLRAQRSGEELDLDACIEAFVDMRLRRVPSDRVYQSTRPTRQSMTVAILVDVSGSTKTALPDGRTVLDVERLSLLFANEALEALGEPFAIFAFSGLGRHDVRVATLRHFNERASTTVHRRISSLASGDNTRLGAAVRHATAALTAQPARRKVLLVLSDGRPNDVDQYQGSDAIEDSRQAILAARAGGISTFCLTVDVDEADYLPHLFGEGGYRVLTDPAHLPGALVQFVERLLRG
ncbi:MAG: VWA domain-containing protein [Gemmatimonadaceae bacterium]|nr:VWA domain-containing protein [Gemmatimonadaceae bacterium]